MLRVPGLPTSLHYGNLVNRDSPLNRGLVSWWLTLPGQGKGNTFFDIASRNHGTLTNGPTWQGPQGRPGGFGFLSFVRASSTSLPVTLGPNAIKTNNAFTLSMWFTNDIAADASSNTNRNLMQSSESANSNLLSYHDRAGFSPNLTFLVRAGFSGPGVATSAYTLAVGRPYHIICVYASSDQRMYLDGVLVASSTTSYTLPYTQSDFTFGSGWDGDLDSIRLYDRALPESQCLNLYNEERYSHPTTLNRVRTFTIFDMGGGGGGGFKSQFARGSNILIQPLTAA